MPRGSCLRAVSCVCFFGGVLGLFICKKNFSLLPPFLPREINTDDFFMSVEKPITPKCFQAPALCTNKGWLIPVHAGRYLIDSTQDHCRKSWWIYCWVVICFPFLLFFCVWAFFLEVYQKELLISSSQKCYGIKLARQSCSYFLIQLTISPL